MSGRPIISLAMGILLVSGAVRLNPAGGNELLNAKQSCPSCNHSCPECCVQCGLKCVPGKLVAKTIMVPITVTETRLKTCIENVDKEFEVKCTVFKREPVTQTIKTKVCYLEDEVRNKVVETKCCARVKNPTVTTFDVEVPEVEERIGPPPSDPCQCGDCGTGDCPCHCANPEANATCDCPACLGNPEGAGPAGDDPNCVRHVCVMRDQPKSVNCEKDAVVFITKSDVCSYCVKVPKYREEVCKEITEYKLVPVVKTKKVVRCVPEIKKRPIEVQVTKMVPKTIYCCEACSKHGAK